MSFIKLEGFSGIAPRTAPTRLDATQAQIANNLKGTEKQLDAWKKEVAVYTPTTTAQIKTIYKHVNWASGAFRWLTFANQVDVCLGPVGDIYESRLYYTGDGFPKKTNWAMSSTNGSGSDPFPNTFLKMGVPTPAAAPTLSASSAASPLETRAYVYTYISTFGSVIEESAPSAATLVNVSSSGATVTVSGFSAAPTTGYNITGIRIYRTITGSSSVVYSFVAQIPLSTPTYADSLSVAQLGSTLTSTYFAEPPAGMIGLTAMANGVLAGFVGNQIWFCEPYLPHAWPSNYMLTVNDLIVGLAFYNGTLVVLTQQQPVLITGQPGAMTQQRLPMSQPCVSKQSIATDQFGVIYASPNGMVAISAGVADVVTTPLYTRGEWQTITPSTMVGAVYNNLYVGFSVQTVNGTKAALVLARGDIPPLYTLTYQASAVHVDTQLGALFFVSALDNKIYQFDADPNNFLFYEWYSKRFVMPVPTNFGAMKVEGDYSSVSNALAYNAQVEAISASNQAIFAANSTNLRGVLGGQMLNQYQVNGSILASIPALIGNRSATVFIYADQELLYTQGVYSNEPVRLPAGQKNYEFEIKISGNVPVSGLTIASSMDELRQVANG